VAGVVKMVRHAQDVYVKGELRSEQQKGQVLREGPVLPVLPGLEISPGLGRQKLGLTHHRATARPDRFAGISCNRPPSLDKLS
jgi:hypothetical protein